MRFDRRVGLVTGAASGIGRVCATRFVHEGARLAALDRDETGLEALAAELGKDRCQPFVLDVTDGPACVKTIGAAVEFLGGLDFAANIAGIGGALESTERYDHDEWRRVLAVNLDGVFYCLRTELEAMSEGAAVVNMASMFSVVARDLMPAYVASKHGVLGLTKAAAIDCAERGIRINAVGPAVIDTPLLRQNVSAEEVGRLASHNPMNRLGSTAEVAALVCWLCSDEATFSSGGFYPVDGAFTAR